MHPEEAQAKQEAAHPVQHATADGAREEVQGEAVPQHSGAGRVLKQPQPHRDSGEDMVSKPARKVKAAPGGRD
jgi:hypothetical protein